jgi:hypothetical protein
MIHMDDLDPAVQEAACSVMLALARVKPGPVLKEVRAPLQLTAVAAAIAVARRMVVVVRTGWWWLLLPRQGCTAAGVLLCADHAGCGWQECLLHAWGMRAGWWWLLLPYQPGAAARCKCKVPGC